MARQGIRPTRMVRCVRKRSRHAKSLGLVRVIFRLQGSAAVRLGRHQRSNLADLCPAATHARVGHLGIKLRSARLCVPTT